MHPSSPLYKIINNRKSTIESLSDSLPGLNVFELLKSERE